MALTGSEPPADHEHWTLRVLAELEGFDRGRYAGPVGWIDGDGDGEWAIALRCAQIGPDAERPAGAGDDDDADLVVPGRVLERPRELTQHPEVERVQDVGAVEPDRRAGGRLLVDDRLEGVVGGIARTRVRRLAHWHVVCP